MSPDRCHFYYYTTNAFSLVVPVNADGVLAFPDGGPHAAYAHSAPELAAMMLAVTQPSNVAQQLAYYTAGELVTSYIFHPLMDESLGNLKLI